MTIVMTTVMTTQKTSETARRIRRAVLFVVSLLAVAVAWELYKAVGPEAGGKIFVCSPCFKKRKLDENNLVDGALIVGGAKLVEFMAEACPSVSY